MEILETSQSVENKGESEYSLENVEILEASCEKTLFVMMTPLSVTDRIGKGVCWKRGLFERFHVGNHVL